MSELERVETIREALNEAATILRAAGVNDPRREAASLLMWTIARDRAYLFTHDEEAVDAESAARFRESVERRASGEPAQYITGRQEFYGLEFEVTRDVLIPRPETELLVETALELLKETGSPLVCDVGVGSGCIAVALLCERKDARALGLDVSPAALAVAARNAARHNVSERLTLRLSDCFEALDEDEASAARTDSPARSDGFARFDMIVSNPPYVAEEEMEGLQREVRDYEPRTALTPGGDGLAIIRRLIADAPGRLAPGGLLLIEIGFNQHERVARLVDPSAWRLLDIHRDLQGIPRIAALQLRRTTSDATS